MPHLALDGHGLWYEDSGGAGVPVVFSHAAAGNTGFWQHQIPAFTAAGFRCITYDRRGFAQSRGDADWEGGGSQLGDLSALADALRLQRFAFIGTAGGTTAGILFAQQHPDRVRALAITCGMGVLMLPDYRELWASLLPHPMDQSAPVIEREIGATYRASDPEGVRRWEECHAANDPPPRARQPLGGTMTLDDLGAMRTPMLFLASDEDGYAPPPVMQYQAERAPGSQFIVIHGAGHSAFWERPDEWNGHVLAFLQAHL